MPNISHTPNTKPRKTILAFGTFDIIHPGHIYYLNEAKKLGDYLVVVIARDQNITNNQNIVSDHNKHHQVVNSEQHRLQVVANIKAVDRAILGNVGDKLKILTELHPDILALGYDHPTPVTDTPIIRIAKLASYSSTIIKQKIQANTTI